MKVIIGYLREYVSALNLKAFACTSLLMAILVTLNYTLGIERYITSLPAIRQFAGFACLFAFVFGSAYWLQFYFEKHLPSPLRFFYWLLLAAPLLFALKMSLDPFTVWLTHGFPGPWNTYAFRTLNWPLKAVLISSLIVLIWYWGKYEKPVAGLSGKGFDIKPYFLLLLFMLPLLAFAATQPDFLQTYPKVHRIAFIDDYTAQGVWWKLLYELAYGSDFFTIELFFRGFLILAFLRYTGKNAILPMAAFYCSIHFGKPLFECITSYFGGLILGVVVMNTRSIWGGLIVHLGIAWLMELAGYLGHLWK